MTTTIEYLTEQKHLAGAATEGPWRPGDVYPLVAPSKIDGISFPAAREVDVAQREADTAFIAAARTSLPKLIAALEAVMALLSSEEAFLDHQEEMGQGAQRRAIGIGRVRAAIEAALRGESDD